MAVWLILDYQLKNMPVVAYFTKEVKPSLAKPSLKLNGDIYKVGLTFLLQQNSGVQLVDSSGTCGARTESTPQIEGCLAVPQTDI